MSVRFMIRLVFAFILGLVLFGMGLYYLLIGEVRNGLGAIGFGAFFVFLVVTAVLVKRFRDRRLNAAAAARAQARQPQQYQQPQQHPQQWPAPGYGHPQQPYRPGPPPQPGPWQGHPPRPPHPPHR